MLSAVDTHNLINFLENFPDSLFSLPALILLVKGLAVSLLLLPLVLLVLDYLDFRRLQTVKPVLLELTPPSMSLKDPHATNQFFVMIHGLLSLGSRWERLIGHRQTMAFQVVSTREEGIRFVVGVPESNVTAFKQIAASYSKEIKFKLVDHLPLGNDGRWANLVEFRQRRHFAFPLARHETLSKHDPIAYITGSMAKPEPGETMILQMVLTPAHSREAMRIYNNMLVGGNPDFFELSWTLPFRVAWKVLGVVVHAVLSLLEAVSEISGRPSAPSVAYSPRPVTGAARARDEGMLAKLGEPLFRVDLRAYLVTNTSQRSRERMTGLLGSLASLSNPGFQSLVLRTRFPWRWRRRYRFFKFSRLLPSLVPSWGSTLSASEVSSIYHFPYGEATGAENLVKSYAKTLPAPVAVKRHADSESFDVVLGRNNHHGSDTLIGLTAAERERHVYIIGGTGNGKTTMLEYSIVQDIRSGKGVAIVDPHGDSAQKLLRYIPEERLKDVIYLNPRDLDHPIGLNMLELPEGLTGSDLAHEKDLVAEAVISVLRKIFDNNGEGGAYRIERVLRNAIHTAFTVEGATLFTVLRLLTDAAFRKQVTRNLKDESLKRFWKEELGKAGEFQRVKISGGPISRIERYERSEAAKRMLGQSKSTINFEDILNSGKILICNFSKGRLGEDTSTLFGTTVLAKLQLAAWRRDEIPEGERRPFYLYVDEFQNFANESFMSLFSEARKYKLFVTMAQQSVAQLSEQSMLNTIIDNVGTIVAFRSKSPDTERLLLHQLSPFIDKGEIGNLPSFNFYIKIAAVNPQEPMSGETLLLEGGGSEVAAKRVIDESRGRYGVAYEEHPKADAGKTKKNMPAAGGQEGEGQQVESDGSDGLPQIDGSMA